MDQSEKMRIGVCDIAFVIAGVVFLVGVLTVFGACGPKEDGTWMTCHWANMAVAGIAGALLITSIAHIAVKDSKVKIGIDIAAIPLALLAALTPGVLIDLCMMNTMHCHAVMRPAVIAFSILIIVIAIADIVQQRNAGLPKRTL